MSLNIILHVGSFSTNLLTILFRIIWFYILIIQFWHSTSFNVRLSYHFRALLLWMLSSLFCRKYWLIIRSNIFQLHILLNSNRWFFKSLIQKLIMFICPSKRFLLTAALIFLSYARTFSWTRLEKLQRSSL